MAQGAERLVGRAEELGRISDALAELADGRPALIELVGEPGIGKTRLLAELAQIADARGQLVLSGCASELERDQPFWVFIDALDDYIQALEPSRLGSLSDAVRAELAVVLPSLAAYGASGDAAVHHERYRTYRAVRELLELLAESQPLVLLLDDLHWGDPASVELLATLLNRPPAAAVLLAFAARPRQMPERLLAAVEHGEREGTVARCELGALTLDEAGELLGSAVGRTEAGVLYEDSGGNPFYLEQLARMLGRRGTGLDASTDLSLGGARVPRIVAAALAEELGLLTADARLVLEGAAVAGDPFDPEAAAAAAGTAESTAIDALDELLRFDLVRETDVPRRFRFRHPLVRRSVYESTPGGWRLGAHERSGGELLRRGASASARAHHVERAARHGDLVAIATLREAGEAAAQRAPASAARWYAATLRLLAAETPADERVELQLALSAALAATGQFEKSHAALIECTTIVPDDADALRIRVAVACAGVERLLGRHTQARSRLETALDELREPESPEAVALMLELASDSLLRMDYDAIHGWAARACAVAEPLGDPVLSAAAQAMQALAAAMAGAISDAKLHCDRAAALVDGLPDEHLAKHLDGLANLATAEMYTDRFEASGRHAERALAIGRATGQGDLFPLIFPMLGTARWLQGRIAESVQIFDDAIDAARMLGNVQGLAWNLFNRAFVATVAGDSETAISDATESIELAKALDDSLISAHAAWALAGALLEIGQAEKAAELLIASTGGEELRLIPGGWRAYGLELLTRCLLAAGRRPEAERAAQAAAACAKDVGLPMASGVAVRAAAILSLDRGDAAGAAEQALTSATTLEEAGSLVDAAISTALAGRSLAQAGDRVGAAAELERAAAAFASFGCTGQQAKAERELRKLGRRMGPRGRPGKPDELGVGSLSERELEVARLIVDRRTNSQIAATLFLSQKTVETHIRNMFRKLDVSSRVDLARAVERAERA
jgi:DNA-binding NarL/FixJ family response regulator